MASHSLYSLPILTRPWAILNLLFVSVYLPTIYSFIHLFLTFKISGTARWSSFVTGFLDSQNVSGVCLCCDPAAVLSPNRAAVQNLPCLLSSSAPGGYVGCFRLGDTVADAVTDICAQAVVCTCEGTSPGDVLRDELQGQTGPMCFLCSETTGSSLHPCGRAISAPSGGVSVPLLHTLDDTGHFPCSGTSGPRGCSSDAWFSVSQGWCLWATCTSSLVTFLF